MEAAIQPGLTALAMWLNTTFAVFDYNMANLVHRLYEIAPGFFTPFLTFITYLGKGGAALIVFSLILMLFRPTRRYGTAMLLGMAIGALITNVCFKPLAARPRPYVYEGHPYFARFHELWEMMGQYTESDKSFPSGHMTAAMAFSTALFLKGNRKISWTAFFFAFLMGVSRIYLCVHYASDVLGGVVTGAVGGILGYVISIHLPPAFYKKDLRELFSGGKKKKPALARRRRTVELDGEEFSTVQEFFAEITVLLAPGEKPITNLDALNDLLRGGLGEDGGADDLHIRWLHSDKSRADLGYEATLAYYEARMPRVHPDNRERAEQRLAQLRAHEGRTLFDQIVDIMRRKDTGFDCIVTLE